MALGQAAVDAGSFITARPEPGDGVACGHTLEHRAIGAVGKTGRAAFDPPRLVVEVATGDQFATGDVANRLEVGNLVSGSP